MLHLNIKLARKKKGLTQAELGAILGVTFNTVSGYETGRAVPDVNTLAMIAQALDTTVNALMSIPENDESPSLDRLTRIIEKQQDLIVSQHQFEREQQDTITRLVSLLGK